MRISFVASVAFAGTLAAQDMVVNYLGGSRTSAGFDSLVTEPAAIAISPDSRWLYVTQLSRDLILRYDLRERRVESIPVRGWMQTLRSDPVTGIAVNDDGSVLFPMGAQIGRADLESRITLPGLAFRPQGTAPTVLRAVVHPVSGAGRNGTTGVFGEVTNFRTLWNILSPTFNTFLFANLQTCFGSSCDNSTLPPNSLPGSFRSKALWGFALASSTLAYVTDPEGPVASGLNLTGVIASVQSTGGGLVTIVGHAALSAIPMGSTGARLSRPTGIVVDPNNNLIVADTGNHRILKRTPTGAWSILAGTGVRGALGDGGPATGAQLFEPRSVAMDPAGVLYIHDSGNGFLRRVLLDGTIERVNQTSEPSQTLIRDLTLPQVSALATDRSGQIYAASQGRIVRVDSEGRAAYIAGTGQYGVTGDGVPAATSMLDLIRGMTVDGDGLLNWSETFRIRRLEESGLVYTVAGNGRQRPGDLSDTYPDPAPALSVYLQPTKLSTASDGSILIIEGDWLRRMKNDMITSVTGVPWCRGYAEGIPAIFACTGASGLETGGSTEPSSFLAGSDDGALLYDGNGGQSLRKIDPEGFVSTVARMNGLRIVTMAPARDGGVFAVLYNGLAGQNQAYYQLMKIMENGAQIRLTSDRRPQQIPAVNPGQSSLEWGLYDAPPIASDARGFLYAWDSVSRRILVFGERAVVTIDSEPSGRQVMIDGEPATTPQRVPWLPGDYHTVEVPAGDEPFYGWSHGKTNDRKVTWMPGAGESRIVARMTTP